MPFGANIPITALNLGFIGEPSRSGDYKIASRPVLPTTTNPIGFGSPVVIVPTSGGGDSYQSVADFIAGGGTMTAALFAGVAVRNVKTNLSYTSLEAVNTPGVIGTYLQGQLAEALESGSVKVYLQNQVVAPSSQGTVYLRTATNGTYPSAVVGGFESSATTGCIALTGVVFRTGYVDSNGVVEITLLNRVAA